MCSTLKISQNLKSEKEVILVEFALPCLALTPVKVRVAVPSDCTIFVVLLIPKNKCRAVS